MFDPVPFAGARWQVGGVSRTHLCKEVWRYTRDEGGPLDAGSQVQASNHCKPLPLRAVVVSVAANGGANPIRCVFRRGERKRTADDVSKCQR
jgi:hypothetical protein